MLGQIAFGGPDDQKRTPRVYGSMPAENVYQLGLEMKQAGEECSPILSAILGDIFWKMPKYPAILSILSSDVKLTP